MKFFHNEMFDFEVQIALGSVYYRAADVGEILSTIDRIKDGDYEGWFREWYATAERVHRIADECASANHRVSARAAYLRASGYYFMATRSLDGTTNPERLLPTWEVHRRCFDSFASLQQPAIEKVAIPYEGKSLVGYLFNPEDSIKPRPTIILNNGSDGPVNYMWVGGAAAALERGYNALTFDGPGQGEALWIQNIAFRPDWEKVITPVIDFLLQRPEVDPRKIVLTGISQAGYWAPRAAAFEKRLAAIVADGGVCDVGASWFKNLPPQLTGLLQANQREAFDRAMGAGLASAPPVVQQTLKFRMKPYGFSSYFDAFKAVTQYSLDGIVEQIECPVLITDPEQEQFFPGQSQQLYDRLKCPKTILRFTEAEGADFHCEPKARSLYDQRVFDWIDEIVSAK